MRLTPARPARPRGRAANVATLFALAVVPMLGVVGLAVDFGRLSVAKGQLDQAADSAALLAASAAGNAYSAGSADPAQAASVAGQTRFQAESAAQAGVTIGSLDVAVAQNGGRFTATVSYAGSIPTTFASLFGLPSWSFAGQSVASLSLNPSVDVQILMDSSASMLLAATPADVAAMQTLTANFRPTPQDPLPSNVGLGESCQFACHWSPHAQDFYALAQAAGVQLRLSVLRGAVDGVIQTLIGQDADGRFRLGLYTFNQSFNTAYALSSDLAGAEAAVGAIQPDVNDCSANCPDTYFDAAMSELTALDQAQPQGPTAPQRFLIIVGDGVYDQNGAGGRTIGPYAPQDCAALKAMGVTILVLYTPYDPIPSNAFYMQHVNPFQPQIGSYLQSCASSPTYVKVADDAASIRTQLQALIELVVQTSSHLVQ